MFRFEKYHPENSLQDHIHSYFLIDLKKSEQSNQTHAMTNHPQGTVDLMFCLEGGVKLANFKGDSVDLDRIFLMAQQEGFFSIDFNPDSYIVGVVFYAESFKKLFNIPMEEVKNTGIGLEHNLNTEYLELFDQLASLNKEEFIPQLFDQFWKKQLNNVDYSFTDLDKIIQHIRKTKGTTKMDQLAIDANLSNRSLQRKIKEITGVTPKTYSTVMRFKEVMNLIGSHQEIDWQDILYETGYFDQAHFIKDFKRYTGKTPSEFLKEDQNLSKFFSEP